MTTSVRRIVISAGEPAGVGPDIVIQIAQQSWAAELVIVADPDLLLERAAQLGLPLSLHEIDFQVDAKFHEPGQLKIFPNKLSVPVEPGKLDSRNASYVLSCLEIATDFCLEKKAQALVTGPVHKSNIIDAGFSFSGHTEFLAERCKVSKALMLFVIDNLKVALQTIHIPLSAVPAAITQASLEQTLRLLHQELQNKFHLYNPRIIVCGLNPHAGENGHLGREEIDIIEPVLKTLRKDNIHVIGPLPADTVFTEKHLHSADAILAMYHDQALPVVKSMGFDRAVNVTLGLPIIRTSVDHGTALDVAGTLAADSGSLAYALGLAIELTK